MKTYKEVCNMATFVILSIILLIILIIAAISLGVGGIAFIIIFGDVIVCIGIIVLIIKHMIKRHK